MNMIRLQKAFEDKGVLYLLMEVDYADLPSFLDMDQQSMKVRVNLR
jgi:hypothetical protein